MEATTCKMPPDKELMAMFRPILDNADAIRLSEWKTPNTADPFDDEKVLRNIEENDEAFNRLLDDVEKGI